jgi:oligoendopeptidase F
MPAAQTSLPAEKTQERSTIASQHRWNVEALYPSWEAWEEDLKAWGREEATTHWPEITPLRNTWSQSPENLKKLIELCCDIDRHLSKLYTYSHLRHDEDVAEETAKKAQSRITSMPLGERQRGSSQKFFNFPRIN